ncbi:MAG: 4-hydroxybenzoate octaprenyltransferase [Planctomycetota bacterium]
MVALLSNMHTWGRMIKFSHSIFALPFALLATFLAARPGLPEWGQLGLIVAAMVAARSAAMTFNRLADINYDALNPRTADRALPRGIISSAAAWLFFLAACVAFALVCGGFWLFYHNPWPTILCLPTIGLLCLYSYTKRFTQWSHLALGAAIACAPVAAWIAINPATLGPPTWLLMVAVSFWIAGFDVIYACQDTDFDHSVGLFSIPARLGVASALWLARVFHLITVVALLGVGYTGKLGTLYYLGVGCVAVLLIVENALVRPNNLSRVNVAFFTVNSIVGLILGILGILDIILT